MLFRVQHILKLRILSILQMNLTLSSAVGVFCQLTCVHLASESGCVLLNQVSSCELRSQIENPQKQFLCRHSPTYRVLKPTQCLCYWCNNVICTHGELGEIKMKETDITHWNGLYRGKELRNINPICENFTNVVSPIMAFENYSISCPRSESKIWHILVALCRGLKWKRKKSSHVL